MRGLEALDASTRAGGKVDTTESLQHNGRTRQGP
jgi:hypothetical protein